MDTHKIIAAATKAGWFSREKNIPVSLLNEFLIHYHQKEATKEDPEAWREEHERRQHEELIELLSQINYWSTSNGVTTNTRQPKEDPEVWRAEYLAKQAAGVRFERNLATYGWLPGIFAFSGKIEDYREAEEDSEAWREEYRKKQAVGVEFEWFDEGKWRGGYKGSIFTFDIGNKEDYREGQAGDNITIPHLKERELWLAQRKAGTNEVWQYRNYCADAWVDIPVKQEPIWLENVEYQVKSKTVKYYFALVIYPLGSSGAFVKYSKEDVVALAKLYGCTIIGNIEEREVEV